MNDTQTTELTPIEMIERERNRQITREGWSIKHDDKQNLDQLSWAAVAYVMPDPVMRFAEANMANSHHASSMCLSRECLWPWPATTYKPTPHDRMRELVKAGALIVAEMERLQRVDKENEK